MPKRFVMEKLNVYSSHQKSLFDRSDDLKQRFKVTLEKHLLLIEYMETYILMINNFVSRMNRGN